MKQQDILETFAFCLVYQGKEHTYRVTPHDEQYALECDGIFTAEVQCVDAIWKQVSGKPLRAAFVAEIGERIEAHFC